MKIFESKAYPYVILYSVLGKFLNGRIYYKKRAKVFLEQSSGNTIKRVREEEGDRTEIKERDRRENTYIFTCNIHYLKLTIRRHE